MAETISRRIWVLEEGQARQERENLPRERPFTIQVRAGRERRNATETTRTPGHDYELAAGLLYSQGYIRSRHDFSHMTYCVQEAGRQEYSLLTVALYAARMPALPRPEEVVIDGNSCGVSSDNLLAALGARAPESLPAGPVLPRPEEVVIDGNSCGVSSDNLLAALGARAPESLPAGPVLPVRALAAQASEVPVGAAFFDAAGELQVARQDVRPLQALDKVIGWALLEERLPLGPGVLWLPGPADYAMMERAVLAGAPLVGSRGRPGSLAVSAAHRHGITLFAVRDDEVWLYTGRERVTAGS